MTHPVALERSIAFQSLTREQRAPERVNHPNMTLADNPAPFVLEYTELRKEGVTTMQQLVGYDRSVPNCTVTTVYKVVNPELDACFDAACALANQINRNRTKPFSGNGVMTVFHGTTPKAIDRILRVGFDVRHNKIAKYGEQAIYVSKYPCVAEKHAAMTITRYKYILWCEALVGNNVGTKDLGAKPLPDEIDSGGDGTGHIIAIFKGVHVCPKYVLQIAEA